MNILSATNALKGIKLKELDDEFQIAIMNVVNAAFPDSVIVTAEATGEEIRRLIDQELPATSRLELMRVAIFAENNDIVRFYNNVEKLQEAAQQAMNYDDAIKGNFISNLAFLVIIVVIALMAIYLYTEDTRGKVPESRVGRIATKIVDNLANSPVQTTIVEETK